MFSDRIITNFLLIVTVKSVADSKGRPPLLAHILFSKSRFFRAKGIYFVVRICDKLGWS